MKYAHYLHKFESNSEFDAAYNGSNYDEPWVSATNTGNDEYRVNYNKSEYEKLFETPLTFEITSDGNIRWRAANTATTKTIEYKKNDGEWTEITSATGSSAPTISVVSGDTVQFRGDNATYAGGSDLFKFPSGYFYGTTAGFKLKGNIMSLIDSTGYTTAILQSGHTFYNLFNSCDKLTDASQLILPPTTLTVSTYHELFGGCTSLTTAPELPATTLADSCYNGMFRLCKSLITAPELPATTLADSCYSYMFSECTNLNYIKCLATDISATNCTDNWVYGVASSGTFVAASNLVNWPSGSDGIPTNWTRENMVESD